MSISNSDRLDTLRKKIKAMPAVPGVYLLLGPEGQVLYIGKSKNLRQRLHHYLNPGKWASDKIIELSKSFSDISVFRTASEQEAFELEIDMIVEHRPPYNGSMPGVPIRIRSPQEPTLRTQVMNHVRDLIRCGKLRPGDRLPKYQQLADELRVSKSTVEWAYWGIKSDNLVTRIPYAAWIVNKDVLQHLE